MIVFLCLMGAAGAPWCDGQTVADPPADPPKAEDATESKAPTKPGDVDELGLKKDDRRIMGLLPNYKTVPDSSVPYKPLTTGQKFYIATHDTFDWPMFFIAGFYAGYNHLNNEYPEWGQGTEGFAKRYGAAFLDQMSGNYLTEAILPTVFHHDPRYFRLGHGSFVKRTTYAMSWVFVSHRDSGRLGFNAPEILGSGMSAALGAAYYPGEERTVHEVVHRYYFQVASDSVFAILKEYWPDIRQKLLHK